VFENCPNIEGFFVVRVLLIGVVAIVAATASAFAKREYCAESAIYGNVRTVQEVSQTGWPHVVLIETTSGIPLQRNYCENEKNGKRRVVNYGLGVLVMTEETQNWKGTLKLVDRKGRLRLLQVLDPQDGLTSSQVFGVNGELVGSVTSQKIHITDPTGIRLLSPTRRFGTSGNDSIDHVFTVTQLLFQQHKKSDITEVLVAWMLAYIGEGTGQWRDFYFRDWMLHERDAALAMFKELDPETAKIIARNVSLAFEGLRHLDNFQTLYADKSGPGIDELKRYVVDKLADIVRMKLVNDVAQKRMLENTRRNGQSANIAKDEERLPQE
jgi:hypothetical protein